MNLERYLENLERDVEQNAGEKGYVDEMIQNNSRVTQWEEEKKEDIYDAMDKVEAALNTYNALARLQELGEDITDGLEVANKAFEEALSNLGKYNISKEELEKYINRRDAIINSNIESKNERTL